MVYYNLNGASLTRCSQPMVGILGSRSEYDEKMIKEIRELNHMKNRLHIVDCRAKISPWANSAKGAGTGIKKKKNLKIHIINSSNIKNRKYQQLSQL